MLTPASETTIYIGTKNLSSWSLRGWLPLKAVGVSFNEVVISLDTPETRAQIAKVSPAGLVPCLHHEGIILWDSLAIGEYLAERFPEASLWPADAKARAYARCVVAEMHSGFAPLRQRMSMNLKARYVDFVIPEEAKPSIARIQALWRECRAQYGAHGPYLFGTYTLADMFYLPVVTRFRTYNVPVDETCAVYMAAMEAHPHYQEWLAAAVAEPEKVAA